MGHGKLWETLAAGRPEFGNPAVFDNHVDESTWVSFTVTLNDPTFFSLIEAFSGKYARSRDFAFRTVRSFRAIDRLREKYPHFPNPHTRIHTRIAVGSCWCALDDNRTKVQHLLSFLLFPGLSWMA